MPGSNGGFTALETLAELDADLGALRGRPIDRLDAFATASARSFARRRAWSRGRTAATAESTTHLVVIDRDRTVVSLTATLADNFGSGAMLPGTGIVLNNAMQWFNPEPGTPVSIRAAGRGLNNMTPLLVRREGRPWLGLGSAGGIRIIDAVTQIVVNAAARGLALERALAEPRVDRSGDVLLVDERIPTSVVGALRQRGHPVELVEESVHAHQFSRPIAAAVEGEWLVGAVDPIHPAVAAGF
jgi:gamma-glutamyltranspeptidase/glutathione hydrolase